MLDDYFRLTETTILVYLRQQSQTNLRQLSKTTLPTFLDQLCQLSQTILHNNFETTCPKQSQKIISMTISGNYEDNFDAVFKQSQIFIQNKIEQISTIFSVILGSFKDINDTAKITVNSVQLNFVCIYT